MATITARLAALPDAGATVTLIDAGRIRLDLADPTRADVGTRVAIAPGVFRIEAVLGDIAGEAAAGRPLPSGMLVHEVVGPGHVASARSAST